MSRKSLSLFSFLILCFNVLLFSGACKNSGPSTPYDLPFTPTATFTFTPTPVINIPGSVNVFVEDKGLAVPGLTILAIPPSGAITYSQATTTTGIATFNSTNLQLGSWTFVVPAQTPFPYAPSTITMPVTISNETADFNTAGAAIYLTPTVPESFTSTNPGSPYTYNTVYSQPGNLFVPATLAFTGFPTNWNGSYGPTTFGYGSADTGSVTVIANNCVDQAPSFAVTLTDSTGYVRAVSSQQTISKAFTSNITVTWNTTGLNNNFCNDGNGVGIVNGTLTVSTSNACSYDVSVAVSLNVGDCCYSQFQTPNGNVSGANCGGGSVNFGPGSYNCTVYSGATWGALNCSCRGQNNTVAVPTSGSVQLISVNY